MKDYRTKGPEVLKFVFSHPKVNGVPGKTNKLVFEAGKGPSTKKGSRCIGVRKVGLEKIFKIGENFRDAFSPEFLKEFGDKIHN